MCVCTRGAQPHCRWQLLWLSEADSLAYAWPWNELVERRECFRNQVTFEQFLGQAAERLHRVRKQLGLGKEGEAQEAAALDAASTAAVSKLFSHAFRLLFETRRLVSGADLHVAPRGEEHTFIMSIRNGPLAGALAPAALLAKATALLDELKLKGAADLPPLPDTEMLRAFVTSVRLRQHAREEASRAAAAAEATIAEAATASASADEAAAPSDAAVEVPVSRQSSTASDEATADGALALVTAAIDQFEQSERVRVLWATEYGSRAIGTDHAGSDRDVLVVFAHPPTAYFSLRKPKETVRASFGGAGSLEVEICAYEARHAMGMLVANNPSIFLGVRSPIVYVDRGDWLPRARALVDVHFDEAALVASWRHHARRNWKDYIKGAAGRASA